MTNLMLIDDHELILDSLSQVLPLQIPNLNIMAYNNAQNALDRLEESNEIDLILVDLDMPNINGLAFLAKLNTIPNPCPVAILSASQDPDIINQALNAGAQGYISKAHGSKELIDGIQTMLRGDMFIPDSLSSMLTQQITEIPSSEQRAKAMDITQRQHQVLQCVAMGWSNNEIASQLFISEHTVKSHLKQLFQKLASDNRMACVNQAKAKGLLD